MSNPLGLCCVKDASKFEPPGRNSQTTGVVNRFLRQLRPKGTRAESSGKTPNTEPDPARCIIFIGGVRTGTTVFREMLAKHPALVDRHEIFNVTNKLGFYPFLRELVRTEPDAVFPEYAMENFARFLGCGCEAGKISVFDLKYEHLLHAPIPWQLPFTEPHILKFIASRGLKVIHLRRNPLHSLISNLIANRSKRYHLYQRQNREPDISLDEAPIRVDRQQIQESIEIRQQVAALVDRTFPAEQRRSFDYESIFSGEGQFRDEVCAAVADFIGIEDRFNREAMLGKVITRPLSDIVENYAEIADLDQH